MICVRRDVDWPSISDQIKPQPFHSASHSILACSNVAKCPFWLFFYYLSLREIYMSRWATECWKRVTPRESTEAKRHKHHRVNDFSVNKIINVYIFIYILRQHILHKSTLTLSVSFFVFVVPLKCDYCTSTLFCKHLIVNSIQRSNNQHNSTHFYTWIWFDATVNWNQRTHFSTRSMLAHYFEFITHIQRSTGSIDGWMEE